MPRNNWLEPNGQPAPKPAAATFDFRAELATRLGLAPDAEATTEELLALVDKKMSQISSPALPPDKVLISQQELAKLHAEAKWRSTFDEDRREAKIADALQDGRIASFAAEQWRAMMARDETTATKLLKSLPENTAVHVKAFGYTGIDGADEDSGLYETIFGKREN